MTLSLSVARENRNCSFEKLRVFVQSFGCVGVTPTPPPAHPSIRACSHDRVWSWFLILNFDVEFLSFAQHTHTRYTYVHTYTYIHTNTHTYTHIHIHTHIYTQRRTCTHKCTSTHLQTAALEFDLEFCLVVCGVFDFESAISYRNPLAHCVLQCVAVCCSVLQCVAVYYWPNVSHPCHCYLWCFEVICGVLKFQSAIRCRNPRAPCVLQCLLQCLLQWN